MNILPFDRLLPPLFDLGVRFDWIRDATVWYCINGPVTNRRRRLAGNAEDGLLDQGGLTAGLASNT